MVKKKTSTGNVSFQVRLDAETHEKLKQMAEKTEMSLNQLVTGLLRACSDNLHQGEPGRNADGYVTSKGTPKCAFVGKFGEHLTPEEIRHYQLAGEDPPKPYTGEVWFSLDYTGRGYVPGR